MFYIICAINLILSFHNVKAEYDESTVIFTSSNGQSKVTENFLESFKVKYDIKKERELFVQEISVLDNTFIYNDKIYSISNAERYNLFSSHTTFMRDGEYSQLPDVYAYRIEDSTEVVSIYVDVDGAVETIFIIQKESNTVVQFVSIAPNILVQIEEVDYDHDSMNEKYGMILKDEILEQTDDDVSDQKSGACDFEYQIEMAVAVESSFCSQFGGTPADAENKIGQIIDLVAKKFEQDDLCVKVVASHIEVFCSADSDIYAEMVGLNLSGCGNDGLIDAFQDLWVAERPVSVAQRDVAHLFSGTALECSADGVCKNGCAFERGICTLEFGTEDRGFAASWISFNPNLAMQAGLVARLLGFNCGATYESSGTSLMSENFNDSSGFSANSVAEMLKLFDSDSGACVLDNVPVKPSDDTPDCKQGLRRFISKIKSK